MFLVALAPILRCAAIRRFGGARRSMFLVALARRAM
jgi:hypothetical protein